MTAKFAFVTPWYNSFAGGAEVACREFAENLTKYGFEVDVLTTKCKSPYDSWWQDYNYHDEEIVNGVRVLRFSVNNYLKEKYDGTIIKQIHKQKLDYEDKENFFTYGINSDELIDYVNELDNSYNIVAMPYFHALTYSLITRVPNRVNLLPCFHNESQFYWGQTKKMINLCKNLLYLSEPEKDMTISKYGLSIGRKVVEAKVVGVGVDINVLETQSINLGLPENYFVYVGRKDVGKGVLKLVDWYLKSGVNIPLVFVGGGEKSLIPDNDKFIDFGFVSEDEKAYIIKNSCALINLSQNESFSLVIMEGWLCGKPVVVSSQCDVTKMHCVNSNGGFWVQNENEFSSIIQHLLENPQIAEAVGNNGRDYVKTNYNWNAVLTRLLDGIGCE